MPSNGRMNDLYEPKLKALKEKHAYLSSRIEEIQKQPSATDYYIKQLKKQKLLIKDQLEKAHMCVANQDNLLEGVSS